MDRKIRLVVDQNFDHFLTSFFGRFGAVLGVHLGVIFGTFGGQDRPRSVQNTSWKLIFIKNVNFHQTLRLLIPQRFLEPQDGSQNAPRSAQDGSKSLLESNFFGLENRLKFGRVLDAILVDFGSPNGAPSGRSTRRLGVWKLTFLGHVILVGFGWALRRPKRRPRAPKTPPRAPQEAPRGRQERPRRLQEGLKSTPGGSKKASRASKLTPRGSRRL